jgi:hypothetical protein
VAGNTVAVTFPAGRFSVPPLVFVTKNYASSPKDTPYAISVTTSGFTLGVYSGDGSAGTAATSPIFWEAIQMTATAAAG